MEIAMKATVVDLRYKMNEVLKALDRNEDVEILYHGKTRGTISATPHRISLKVTEHPFFNMLHGKTSVEEEMEQLRGGRYRDL